jgi:hypothetical protein
MLFASFSGAKILHYIQLIDSNKERRDEQEIVRVRSFGGSCGVWQ